MQKKISQKAEIKIKKGEIPDSQKGDLPVISFARQDDWREWLDKNHKSSNGIWLCIFKKKSGRDSVSYDQAIEEALCYGWIDGQKKPKDVDSWHQKFTPRRGKSIWSKRNTDHVERLIKLGKMKPAGLKEIKAAKADGRWEKAYDSPAKMLVPEDFLQKLSKNKKAKAFFDSLNRANVYAITWRLQTAKKPETREKRMKIILEMLSRGEKFH
jgi:uncharacterized protein YdeI (YjbR/CyaY-like superfamily)